MRMRTGVGRAGAVAWLLAALLALLGPGAAMATAGPRQDTSPNARASVDDPDLGWGERTTLRASGFAPGGTVRAILYAGGTTLAEGAAGNDGSFSAAITIPSGVGSSDKYVLAVQGPAADGLFGYVEVPLTITGPTPAVSISGADLSWGEVAEVSGQRYAPGTKVTVSLFPDNTVLAETTAREDATFSASIRVPTNLRSALNYQIAVTGQGIDQLFHFDTIEVAIIGDRPAIEISSERVPRGQTVTITGVLFATGSEVAVTLLPGFERLGTASVGEDGAFSTSVRIPEDAFGPDPHQLVVTGTGRDGLFAYATGRVVIDPPADAATPGETVPTLAPVVVEASIPFFGRVPVDPPLGRPRGADRGSVSPFVILVLMLLVLPLIWATGSRRGPFRSRGLGG